MFKILKDKKKYYIQSLLILLLLALIGLLTPIPHTTTVIVPNLNSFFSIPMIKKAKYNILVDKDVIESSQDNPSIRYFLESKILKSADLDKTINLLFGYTKLDTRELVEPNQFNDKSFDEKLDEANQSRYAIYAVELKNRSFYPKLAEQSLRILSNELLYSTFKERYVTSIEYIRSHYTKQYFELVGHLPNLIMLHNKILSRLVSADSILQKQPYAGNTNITLQLSTNEVSNNNDHIMETYLPPQIQVSGLQIQEKFVENEINQVNFQISIAQEFLNSIENFYKQSLNSMNSREFYNRRLEQLSWLSDPLYKYKEAYHDAWKIGYVETQIGFVENQFKILRTQVDAVEKSSLNSYSELTISRNTFFIILSFIGLCIVLRHKLYNILLNLGRIIK